MGKRNRSFLILGGLAAATAMAGTASAFWNIFGNEGTEVKAPQAQGQITADFSNASVDEVFKWLRGQGIDFVVETTDIKDRRITLNVTAKSKDAVVAAIADALGFSSTKKDSTYVLKGRRQSADTLNWQMSPFSHDGKPMSPEDQAKFEKEMAESLKGLGEGLRVFGSNGQIWENGKLRELTKEEREKAEKDMKAWGDNFKVEFGKSFGPMLEKELENALKDGKVRENGKERAMTAEEKAKLEKEMKELHEKLKDLPSISLRGMSDEDRKKFEAEMEKFGKDMEGLPLLGGKDLFVIPEGHKGMKAPHFSLQTESIQEFKKSLTSAQMELMKSQGFLKPSDLTDAQKKLIGLDKMSGNFNITLSDKETTVTIKGD